MPIRRQIRSGKQAIFDLKTDFEHNLPQKHFLSVREEECSGGTGNTKLFFPFDEVFSLQVMEVDSSITIHPYGICIYQLEVLHIQ